MGRISRKRSRNGGRKLRHYRRHGGSAKSHCEQQLGIALRHSLALQRERDGLRVDQQRALHALHQRDGELADVRRVQESTKAELKEAKELWLHCEERTNEIFSEEGGEDDDDDDVNRLERLRNEVQCERRLREVGRLRAEVRHNTTSVPFGGRKRLVGGKGKKGFSHPKKGKKSRTRRGRKDFTTKKTSHVFDEDSHYVRKGRRPYRKGGKRRTAKKH